MKPKTCENPIRNAGVFIDASRSVRYFVFRAPRPGLEPGTLSLHVILMFPSGVDYIITLREQGRGASRNIAQFVQY